jgi:hypothetical protein
MPLLARTTSGPFCFTRVESNEHKLIETSRDDTDGVVIPLRFDTPPKHGHLKRAALDVKMPFLIDLETWRLPFLEGADDDSFGSDAQTVVAQVVPLPLTPAALEGEEALQSLVRTGLAAQAGAEYAFAPDFQVRVLDDPWLRVNLRCLRMSLALAGDRPVGAWIHITLQTMEEGLLPYLAEIYARELPAGSLVALTVSDLRLELPPETVATYLKGLAAFEKAGLRVLIDRASEVSIPTVATYAVGCMVGTRLYRTAPPAPNFESEFNPKIKLQYFVGDQARRVPRHLARQRYAKGKLGSCSKVGCSAVTAGKSKNIDVRLHNAHEFRRAVREARRKGHAGLIAEWQRAPLKHLRTWAQALEDAMSFREEA